jgi:hypothetical protein
VRNRGELAEGWYDPSTFQKAQQSASSSAPDHDGSSNTRPSATASSSTAARDPAANDAAEEDSDSDDSVGPTLPGQERRSRGRRMGPRIPGMQDLELKRGRGSL